MSSFPLQNLPQNVQKSIIGHLTLIEIFELSRCSRKTRNLVKENYERNGYFITIHFSESTTIWITRIDTGTIGRFNVSKADESVMESRKIGRVEVGFEKTENGSEVITYWNDILGGCASLAIELHKLFSFPFGYMIIDMDKRMDWKSIIGWNRRFERLFFYGEEVSGETYSFILNNINYSKYLAIGMKMNGELVPQKNIDFEELMIDHGNWIRVEHLINFSVAHFKIKSARLCSSALNLYLRQLIEGACPKLKHLEISLDLPINYNDLFKGIEAWPTDERNIRHFVGESCVSSNEGGHEILMKNGDICSVTVGDDERGFPKMEIIVWKGIEWNYKPLRIQYIPFVALDEIIRSMDAMEAFELSMCSGKMRDLVKRIFRKNNFKTSIAAGEYGIVICLFTQPKQYHLVLSMQLPVDFSEKKLWIERIGRKQAVFSRSTQILNCLQTFWCDRLAGAKESFEALRDVFGAPLEEVDVRMDTNEGFGRAIEWIYELGGAKSVTKYVTNIVDDDTYSFILDNTVTENLHVDMKQSIRFNRNEFKTEAKSLYLSSNWMDINHLISLKCEEIHMMESSFRDRNINEFLHLLIQGSNPNLKFIKFRVDRYARPDEVLDGIAGQIMENPRIFECQRMKEEVCHGFQFPLENGDLCAIKFWGDSLRSEIRIYIWRGEAV
uniref:F-box domain-containing protein n=1 Tax=Caenorhabditis tropicalis TaxID=1561998 RepID=A0A1I7TU93_9PELO